MFLFASLFDHVNGRVCSSISRVAVVFFLFVLVDDFVVLCVLLTSDVRGFLISCGL